MLESVFWFFVSLFPSFVMFFICFALLRHVKESKKEQRSSVPFHHLMTIAGLMLAVATFGALSDAWLLLIITLPATLGTSVAVYTAIACQRLSARHLREKLVLLISQEKNRTAEMPRAEHARAA